ncbi:rod shape-determining protein MreD [Dysgonomonas hofstadii]|uniref:Rod shape-determining protein MreD n=1 Tax=Dysgonomonas hofstadii TaxID=637886 RepID=A0A840CRN1_9BACT|nr:rod shape-determining protein MreD [Dysgonomonas hofstadii]MBB4035182.1 rod shape-determining protein MreD [Dysgonomonas hofstadii]
MLKSNIFKYITLFIVLALLQVLVLNKISFLGYAVPFVYIYFILKLPVGCDRNLSTSLGFLLGFSIDVFCNTPGINAAATTLIGFVCRRVQGLFFMVDDYNNQTPGLSLLGGAFMKYAIFITLIHHIVLVSIESFSYFNIKLILLRIFLSAILTIVLIFAFEGFSYKKKNSWQKTS